MLMRSPLARDRRRPEGFIPPALLRPATNVPTGPGWIHELKHDGIWLIARKDRDACSCGPATAGTEQEGPPPVNQAALLLWSVLTSQPPTLTDTISLVVRQPGR